MARALNLYQRWRPKEITKIALLNDYYEAPFGGKKRERNGQDMQRLYRTCLVEDIKDQRREGDTETVKFLESLLPEVEEKPKDIGD